MFVAIGLFLLVLTGFAALASMVSPILGTVIFFGGLIWFIVAACSDWIFGEDTKEEESTGFDTFNWN